MTPAMRSDAKKRLQDCAACVRSLNAGGYDINLASPAANMRRKSTDHIKDVIGLAFDWGALDVVISPGTRRPMISPSLSKTLGWLYESLEILLPRAEQAGVRLLLENTPFRPTFEELVGVVKEVNNEKSERASPLTRATAVARVPSRGGGRRLAASAFNTGTISVGLTGLRSIIAGHEHEPDAALLQCRCDRVAQLLSEPQVEQRGMGRIRLDERGSPCDATGGAE
jgi:hypothetical protein